MIILLIFYLLFLFVYFAFNVYAIFRVLTMRLKGDATGRAIVIYAVAMAVIIFFSFVFIFSLDWPSDFGFGGTP